jgi:hypothetical protein
MKIKFQTKEESNQQQEQAFLALAPYERVQRFFELVKQMKRFKVNSRESDSKTNNFVIVINRE